MEAYFARWPLVATNGQSAKSEAKVRRESVAVEVGAVAATSGASRLEVCLHVKCPARNRDNERNFARRRKGATKQVVVISFLFLRAPT